MQKETEKFVSDQEVLPYLLGDDSDEAQGRACWWAYGNNAGRAYRDFLDRGRGLLWGPYQWIWMIICWTMRLS
jgi:hypothetical protein